MITLSNNVAFFVPSTVNVDSPIDNTPWVNKIATILSRRFGGATITESNGCWVAESGELVQEAVTVVNASFNMDDSNIADIEHWIASIAQQLKDEMTQEMIAVRLDGVLRLY